MGSTDQRNADHRLRVDARESLFRCLCPLQRRNERNATNADQLYWRATNASGNGHTDLRTYGLTMPGQTLFQKRHKLRPRLKPMVAVDRAFRLSGGVASAVHRNYRNAIGVAHPLVPRTNREPEWNLVQMDLARTVKRGGMALTI